MTRPPTSTVPAASGGAPTWARDVVASPLLPEGVPIVVARDIPTVEAANRLQTLTIYLPESEPMLELVGTPVDRMPVRASADRRWLVHIHGGAWRDPQLDSSSIEPTVAHAFSDAATNGILGVVAVNYRLAQFPTHPTMPHHIGTDSPDAAREAVHPQHLDDVSAALDTLRRFSFTDDSYLLSGHSCGACLAMQAVLRAPRDSGLPHRATAPRPAAVIGLNGLYDLPALVDDLDGYHQHLADDYTALLSNAFGTDRGTWRMASPAQFDPAEVSVHLRVGAAPRLVLLDQSPDDQLVPVNQCDRLEATLQKVEGLRVLRGHRCLGEHADPWQRGDSIWQTVRDVLDAL